MGIGPAFAVRSLLERNSLSLEQVDLVEVRGEGRGGEGRGGEEVRGGQGRGGEGREEELKRIRSTIVCRTMCAVLEPQEGKCVLYSKCT